MIPYVDIDDWAELIDESDDASDPPSSATFNPPVEALANRTRWLKNRVFVDTSITDPTDLTAEILMVDGDTRAVAGHGVYRYVAASTALVDTGSNFVVNGNGSVGRWLYEGNKRPIYKHIAIGASRLNGTVAMVNNGSGSAHAPDPAGAWGAGWNSNTGRSGFSLDGGVVILDSGTFKLRTGDVIEVDWSAFIRTIGDPGEIPLYSSAAFGVFLHDIDLGAWLIVPGTVFDPSEQTNFGIHIREAQVLQFSIGCPGNVIVPAFSGEHSAKLRLVAAFAGSQTSGIVAGNGTSIAWKQWRVSY